MMAITTLATIRGGGMEPNEIHPEDVHASHWAQLCCSKPFILVEKFQIYLYCFRLDIYVICNSVEA